MRRGTRATGSAEEWEEWEDGAGDGRRGKKKKLEQSDDSGKEVIGTATVIGSSRGRCTVAFNGEVVDALLSPELIKRQQTELAIGDRVELERPAADTLRVVNVLPRHGILSRPDPQNQERERVIAANIDTIVNVVTLKSPPLRPRLVDRYLAAARRGGCELVVCVNKIDLVDAEELNAGREALAPYRELGAAVIECSAHSGAGLIELRKKIEGTVAVLSGHSGVGKTSLINALNPLMKLRTNTLHKAGGAGRHTTTASTLYKVDEETSIIDTPGIREFGMWKLDRATLASSFTDFDEENGGCRFTDCTHSHEPQCGVREAATAGRISKFRYDSYLRLLEELER